MGSIKVANDALLAELARLEEASIGDPDSLQAEISRAKAVRDIAATVIDSGRLALDLARASVPSGDAAPIPKGLLS